MNDPIILIGIGFPAAALLLSLLALFVHHRAIRLTRRQLEIEPPTSIASIRADQIQLRAQSNHSIRRLEVNVEQLKGRLAAPLRNIDQLKKEHSEKDGIKRALEQEGQVRSDRPFKTQRRFRLSLVGRRPTALASKNKDEIAKLRAELADNGQLLDEREREIDQMRGQLRAIRDKEEELRCVVIAVRSHNTSVERKLRSEISKLEARLSALNNAHGKLRRPN